MSRAYRALTGTCLPRFHGSNFPLAGRGSWKRAILAWLALLAAPVHGLTRGGEHGANCAAALGRDVGLATVIFAACKPLTWRAASIVPFRAV